MSVRAGGMAAPALRHSAAMSKVPRAYLAYWCHGLHKLRILHIFWLILLIVAFFLHIAGTAYCLGFHPPYVCIFFAYVKFFLHNLHDFSVHDCNCY